MDRKNTESADVSEDTTGPEILVVGTIFLAAGHITITPTRPSVVFRQHGAKSDPHHVYEVGLDKSRWTEIAPRSDEGEEVADDTLESDSVDGVS